jgi:tagatose-1,6-bisphosphate aldolase non-catalytic subunit AgaZ/GatZ
MEKVEKKKYSKRSNFKKTILDEMFTSDQYWRDYFKNISKKELKKNIVNSYYDRTRYYLDGIKVLNSIKVLENNINKIDQKQIIKLLRKEKKNRNLYRIKHYKYKNFDLIVSNYLNEIFTKYYKACGFNF